MSPASDNRPEEWIARNWSVSVQTQNCGNDCRRVRRVLGSGRGVYNPAGALVITCGVYDDEEATGEASVRTQIYAFPSVNHK